MKIDDRVKREAEAYDEGDVYKNSAQLQKRFWHVFQCPNTLFLENYLEDEVAHKALEAVILDYGCLTGEFSYKLSHYHPKQVIGIDISSVGIAAAQNQYGNVAEFYVMDAHQTDFENDTFDLIVGRSILHHLDWEVAINEIKRILKPGGRAIFMEPLGDNPVARLFRLLTPQARTEDELALSRTQIEQADTMIGNAHHQFGNLVSVPLAMLTSLVIKNPNNFILRVTNKIDRCLANTSLKYWMRTVVLVWEKK